jgi:UDP-glucose:tetrahydrobiopterin glucosyltransferase
MRIALIAPLVTPIAQPFVGGAQAILADLAQGLHQRGHTVTLFARAGSFIPAVSIEQVPVPAIVRPSDFSRLDQEHSAEAGFTVQANIFLELFQHLHARQHKFDLIHAHAFDWPAFAFSTLIQDIPIMHTLHLPAVSPDINECLRIFHHYQHPLTLTTVSHSSAATYTNYTPFDYIINNGRNLDIIPFVEYVAPDAPLLFAGRISPEKGVVEAIEIARLAKRHLLIAGNIYDHHYYQEKVAPLLAQEKEHVTYLGQLEHEILWKLMGQSQALLFTLTWDAFSLTPIEAMATGTPVIAFARGSASEMIRHGETGFIVPWGDCEQAAALVQALPSLSRASCRKHVENNFSLVKMLDNYEQAYTKTIYKHASTQIPE